MFLRILRLKPSLMVTFRPKGLDPDSPEEQEGLEDLESLAWAESQGAAEELLEDLELEEEDLEARLAVPEGLESSCSCSASRTCDASRSFCRCRCP